MVDDGDEVGTRHTARRQVAGVRNRAGFDAGNQDPHYITHDSIAPTIRSVRVGSAFIQEPCLSFVLVLFCVFEIALTLQSFQPALAHKEIRCRTS